MFPKHTPTHRHTHANKHPHKHMQLHTSTQALTVKHTQAHTHTHTTHTITLTHTSTGEWDSELGWEVGEFTFRDGSNNPPDYMDKPEEKLNLIKDVKPIGYLPVPKLALSDKQS